jgi:UDP-N-acetylmuramoyl-L-alanyl-D-glutamate--2,6-diaminopimelate ligase
MAVEKGAACVLCQNAPEGEIPYVQTADTRKGLALVSANWFDRPAEKMKIVGVTGTNGKTTTTNLIKTILEEKAGAKVGLLGTNNNMIGDLVLPTERTTPESYEIQELFARMYREGCTHIVMEVSSHALYLDRVYGIGYAVGVFYESDPGSPGFPQDHGKTTAGPRRSCFATVPTGASTRTIPMPA